jgi:glycosyltransferase involved in cell wall biosynthesis
MYRGKKIGVVVPAYNEEELIGETLKGIPNYVDRIYVVDDASTDKTSEIVKEFMKKDDRIVLIRHEKNQGVGGAIVSGYKKGLEEGMDILVVMAGDNQMDPKYLPDLLDPIVEGKADFTKANRLKPGYWKGMSTWRLFGNFLLNYLTKIASGYWNIDDPQNGYVAISSKSLKKYDLDNLYKGYAFENDMMIKGNVLGIKMINVYVPARYGKERSYIKYGRFIVETSWFLLKSFLWRVWKKYLRNFHPLGFLYIGGFILIVFGTVLLLFGYWMPFVVGGVIFIIACILESKLIN